MNLQDVPQDEPAEHLRFRAYLSALEQVTDSDESDLVSEVLTDSDQAMAQSAVIRHFDRRAADLHPEPAYEPWAASMARATVRHPFLTRRLQELSLFRAITLRQPWRPDALLESSDWLQRKAASMSSTEATELLAERGRTKRIRNTAKASLKP
ncbi:hypothetical protein OG689_36780 [Kitasatospora sp. NBC_00240]|uniref:hypothetical protein n=1 Tax=Kitasatospora sp. NBC_00240 TaxID=2903567 RepID=UPI002259727B|nr:hypothetical protein [Kitasatospora sp. NBC_00240]MCX5214753.1 hypothetical protein [Kitasatospora sp. NBC_00240]